MIYKNVEINARCQIWQKFHRIVEFVRIDCVRRIELMSNFLTCDDFLNWLLFVWRKFKKMSDIEKHQRFRTIDCSKKL